MNIHLIHRLNAGSTLVELLMGMAVLSIALGITLESMVYVSNFAGLHARQGDLDEQCRKISRQMHQDLANTAWFVGENPLTNQVERLFPQVVDGGPDQLADELVFLRLRTERTAGATASDSQVEPVNFLTEPPVPMKRYAEAAGVRSLILNPAWVPGNAQSLFATTTWESSAPTIAFEHARDASMLRHYRYIVRPDLTVTGRGILFRETRDGDAAAWITDERIADNLVSITFATNREIPWLNANQLMVSISLQADDLRTGQARAQRNLQMVIAMRSLFSE
jgi:type II secretory pathway pseudopilin PulG